MKRTQSEVIDNITFVFEFDRHGWGRFHMLHDKTARCYWVSDVFSHFSDDMLTLCEHVLENKPIRVALCDEPGGAIISLVPNIEQHHLVEFSIEEIDDPLAGFHSDEKGRQVLRIQLKRKQVIGAMMSELWKTHYLMREPSYQLDRGPFPHERLIGLNELWDKGTLGPSFLK